MRLLNILIKSYATYLKAMLEYRPAFATDMLTNILNYSMMYVGIWILLDKFRMINGWTLYEVLFLFNMNMFSYALGSFIFRNAIYGMDDMVRRGEFDIVLIRPVNSLLYLVFGRPNPSYFGHMLLGIVMFGICFANLDIEWTVLKVVFFILMLTGAVFIQMAMYLFTGSLNFWVVRTQSIFETLTWTFRNFIEYPISIYGKVLQVILTFVIPFAFINFYPSQYFLEKQGDYLFHPVLQYLVLPVGLLLFFLAYRLWVAGINRYESTGS
ncbi:MAG: ABC-2 family transporter protein [Dehalococcoidales bacterium]|nr:ABC-2 family transporter protein [Dehalococcoidales bacterium]